MTTAITHRIPPQRLINFFNPVVRAALESPLHAMVDGALVVLHVRGRRTGHVYDIPVGYLPLDGDILVVTQHAWRANLRGGADIDVTYHGLHRTMHAELDEDPASVARTFQGIVERHGPKKASRVLGLDFHLDGEPSLSELEAAVREFDMATVMLSPVVR